MANGQLLSAANEERFTRRKLDVAFPRLSIQHCLSLAKITSREVDAVAGSTRDPAKAIGRLFPSTKERYYQIRRRHTAPGALASLQSAAKYRITEWKPTWWSARLNHFAVRRELRSLALDAHPLQLHDHHLCHAATAAHGSGFPSCVVITVDGVGDGVASTVSHFRNGKLSFIDGTPACDSPGIFFEHVTALLNMRELEDEGKVMALADYAAPVPDDKNPLIGVLWAERLRFRTSEPAHGLRHVLRRHLWKVPNEQFAYMAQRALTLATIDVVQEALRATGERRVALAGGVASNVKVNGALRRLPQVDDVFVFPHMGDGGLACGAAMLSSIDRQCRPRVDLLDLGLGPSYDEMEIASAVAQNGLTLTRPPSIAAAVADLLAGNRVVLWFQGRMEYGPRALGHRSIIARPDQPEIRDRLNLLLKRRVWYQPFCPSLLEGDAVKSLADWKGAPNRHMTTTHIVRPEYRPALAGVLHVDGSCRPHIVPEEDASSFGALLKAVRDRLGFSAVLNTSFNIHGAPLVCTPTEACGVLVESGADVLAIGPFLVQGIQSPSLDLQGC